jgi:hypothetical protein
MRVTLLYLTESVIQSLPLTRHSTLHLYINEKLHTFNGKKNCPWYKKIVNVPYRIKREGSQCKNVIKTVYFL